MASINILDFINYNSLNNPSLLTRNIGAGFTFTPPRGQLPQSILTLILLAIYDTYHDFGGERGDADFFNKVVAKFLMLNQQTPSNNNDETNSYKDAFSQILSRQNLNFYGPGSYENKVASLFENVASLQKAVTTITYSEIIENVVIDHSLRLLIINSDFLTKIIASNGSLNIIPSLSENLTFERFICAYGNDGDSERDEALLKIGNFIKWYLHSPSLESLGIIDQIRITADAGFFHFGKIMSVSGSGGIPYITVPNILDSASTSISKLDPDNPIEYEKLEQDIVYPIYSNYFSSSIYFICYIVNQGKEFGVDSPFCFSLCIFNIGLLNAMNPASDLQNAIKFIRENVWSLEDEQYISALKNIKLAIDTYPGMVVRYYFGEVERDLMNDTSKCGTCGAGVNYIGRVFSKINSAATVVNSAARVVNSVATVKPIFDQLITEEKLNSRIPISDGRIVKLFKLSESNNIYDFTNIHNLYYLLADYKRTGDYQQIYTILLKIIENGNINTSNYTFSTGDELAALLSRLLRLPTIWQVGSTGRTTLYRNTFFSSTPEQQLENTIERLRFDINKETIQIQEGVYVLRNFLNLYNNLYLLKDKIGLLYEKEDNYFSKLLLINLFYVLNGLLQMANNISSMLLQLDALILMDTTNYTLLELTNHLELKKTVKNQIQTFIVEIVRYFPNFIDDSDSVVTSFNVTKEYFEGTGASTITIPLLNLKFKNKKLIIPQKAKRATDLLVRFSELTLQARRPRPFVNNDVDLFKSLLTDFLENLECADLADEKINFSQLFPSSPSSPPTSIDLGTLDTFLKNVATKVSEGEVAYNDQIVPASGGADRKKVLTKLPKLSTIRNKEKKGQQKKQTEDNRIKLSNWNYVRENFKDILSSIVNKCELFIKDTFYDYGKSVKYINDYCTLSFKYNSLEFCYNLLFGNETELGLLNKLTELSLSLDDTTLISMLRSYDSSYAVRTLLYLLLDLLRRHSSDLRGSSDQDIITEIYSDADVAEIISLIPPRASNPIFESSSPESEYLLYVEPFLLIISIGSIFKKSKFLFFTDEIMGLNEISPTTGANYFLDMFYTKFVTGVYLRFRLYIINNNSTFYDRFNEIKEKKKNATIFAWEPQSGGLKRIYKNKTKKRIKNRKTRKVRKSKKQIRKTYRKKSKRL
jgi:hypothetical protein